MYVLVQVLVVTLVVAVAAAEVWASEQQAYRGAFVLVAPPRAGVPALDAAGAVAVIERVCNETARWPSGGLVHFLFAKGSLAAAVTTTAANELATRDAVKRVCGAGSSVSLREADAAAEGARANVAVVWRANVAYAERRLTHQLNGLFAARHMVAAAAEAAPPRCDVWFDMVLDEGIDGLLLVDHAADVGAVFELVRGLRRFERERSFNYHMFATAAGGDGVLHAPLSDGVRGCGHASARDRVFAARRGPAAAPAPRRAMSNATAAMLLAPRSQLERRALCNTANCHDEIDSTPGGGGFEPVPMPAALAYAAPPTPPAVLPRGSTCARQQCEANAECQTGECSAGLCVPWVPASQIPPFTFDFAVPFNDVRDGDCGGPGDTTGAACHCAACLRDFTLGNCQRLDGSYTGGAAVQGSCIVHDASTNVVTTVTGTEGDDCFIIADTADRARYFLNGGNDCVLTDNAQTRAIYMGEGNDTLFAVNGLHDVLHGGGGSDVIVRWNGGSLNPPGRVSIYTGDAAADNSDDVDRVLTFTGNLDIYLDDGADLLRVRDCNQRIIASTGANASGGADIFEIYRDSSGCTGTSCSVNAGATVVAEARCPEDVPSGNANANDGSFDPECDVV